MYTFKTKLFGLNIKVTGIYYEGEQLTRDLPGSEPEFDIERITHFGSRIDIEALPEDELVRIHLEAFKSYEEEE